MNSVEAFERLMGGRWTGVTFHREIPEHARRAERPMYFCEAVLESSTGPITLTQRDIVCPGARRSLGWHLNGNAALVAKLTGPNGLEIAGAEGSQSTPPARPPLPLQWRNIAPDH